MLISILFSQNVDPLDAVLQFIILFFVFTFSLSIRCYAQALAAYKMGDLTPKAMGRLTLNPVKHFDLKGFIFFLLVGVGWSKAVPINPINFKKYRKGIRWVSSAGIIANFAMGSVAMLVYLIFNRTLGCPNEFMSYFYLVLQIVMLVNSFLVMFNILPIYPLDGFNFVSSFLNGQNGFVKFNIKYGVTILFAVLAISVCSDLLFGVDLFDFYLKILYNYVYIPIALI